MASRRKNLTTLATLERELERRQARYDAAPSGKRSKPLAALRKARAAVKAERDKLERERRRLERERARLTAQVEKIRREQEEYLIRINKIPPVDGGYAPPPPPPLPPLPPPPPQQPPTPPKTPARRPPPNPNDSRNELAKWLLNPEGWTVFIFRDEPEMWSASKVLSYPGSRVPPTPLSRYEKWELVWWRADVRILLPLTPATEAALTDPEPEEDSSLGRPEVQGAPKGYAWRSLKGGTKWHSRPQGLDGSLQTIVDNICDKYLKDRQGNWTAQPAKVEIHLYGRSQNSRPADPPTYNGRGARP